MQDGPKVMLDLEERPQNIHKVKRFRNKYVLKLKSFFKFMFVVWLQ